MVTREDAHELPSWSILQSHVNVKVNLIRHKMLFAVGLLAIGCQVDPVSPPQPGVEVVSQAGTYTAFDSGLELFRLSVDKWSGGHTAAVTITYDAAWGTHADHHLATDAAIERHLPIDLEMVTWVFTQPRWNHLLETYRTELLPRGVRFFGHGHTHALHDTLDYDGAYESFHTCFELMDTWGFAPRAYAYPGSSGLLPSTQQANRDAGFICARGSTLDPDTWHLLSGATPQEPNWYFLPAVPLGNGSYRHLQQHEDLAPVLDQALDLESWVILMYHAVGIPELWGFYDYEEYLADLDQIAAGDYWVAHLGQAAAYARERAGLTVSLTAATDRARTYHLSFRDGLDDGAFAEPLTATLQLSSLSARRVRVDPPVGTGQFVPVVDGAARLALVPAETPALLVLD